MTNSRPLIKSPLRSRIVTNKSNSTQSVKHAATLFYGLGEKKPAPVCKRGVFTDVNVTVLGNWLKRHFPGVGSRSWSATNSLCMWSAGMRMSALSGGDGLRRKDHGGTALFKEGEKSGRYADC